MLESTILIFLLFITVFAIVAATPYFIKNITDAEDNPDHLYNVFMEEAGWHGWRVLSAIGCFQPILVAFKPPEKIEGVVITLLFVGYCFYEHIKLYAGVKIFNTKMSILLSVVIFLIFSFALAQFNNVIESNTEVVLSIICSLFWGFIVNLKRAKLILHNKSLQRQSLRDLDSF